MSVKRININVDEKLLARIDQYAEFMGVTRTAAISFLCANQLFQMILSMLFPERLM